MNAIPEVPIDVIENLEKKKCFLFAGAGVSVPAGYPTWSALLEKMIGIGLNKGYLKTDTGSELSELLKKPSKLLMVAQELSDTMSREILTEEIARYFRSISPQTLDIHDELTKIPFKGVVTTNYDQMLENAYTRKLGTIPPLYTHKDASSFGDALFNEEFFILKAHGDITKRESIVLTQHDYRTIIHSSPGYRTMISAIFLTNSMLFIGVSLDDPETEMLLSYLHHAFAASGPMHHALVPSDSFTEVAASRWRKDFRVNCIRYEPSEGHPEVLEFLKKICSKTGS